MTFGQHLNELRIALAKALLWLCVGVTFGLFFLADDVIRYIQAPLEAAIRQFNADRDLARMGYDIEKPETQPLRTFLMKNGLVWDLVYDIPESLMKELSLRPTVGDEVSTATLLSALPDPSKLTARYQLRRQEVGLSSLRMEEPFMVWLKAGLIVGAVIASPFMFYHLWTFVAAGLHAHERRYVKTFLPMSIGLFVGGVILAFFFVLKLVISFLLVFNNQMDVAIEPRLSDYVNFVLLLPLGFGIAFQLPLVMFFVERIGLVTAQAYIESWRIAILVIAVVSVVLTPPDVYSMVLMMVPLIGLYFLGIALCKYWPSGPGLGGHAYDPR